MAWTFLGISTIFEIAFALGMNAAKGFTRLWPSLMAVAAAEIGSFTFGLAVKTIDVGVGYMLWTGVGSVGTVVMGAVLYNEKITVPRALAFVAIIAGAVLLKVSAGT